MRIDAARPLQIQCAAPACRRRLTVPARNLYFVMSPSRHGGTHKDAAFDCPICGTQNIIPASHLPKGLLGQLPSEQSYRERHTKDVPLPVPAWTIGALARSALQEALIRASADVHGEATALVREEGLLEIDDTPLFHRPIDEVLVHLDRIGCEVLILGGINPGGTRWRMIFDPKVGAATLVDR